MRIQVVYDKNGVIIGGGVGVSEPAHDFRAPRSGPTSGEGQHTGEFEVPAEYSQLSFHDLVERVRVDVKGKEHRLVAKVA
ncbi:MAG: hypothetical protein LAO23_08950 [Acidobacteriia bacterium]|jgi:hypothetical protein|nr:hypothetical protein [Terriglobia bacterium]